MVGEAGDFAFTQLPGIRRGVAQVQEQVDRSFNPSAIYVSPNKLPNWQMTVGKVLSGMGDGAVCYIGDSTSMGSGSAYPKTAIASQWPNARRGSKATHLTRLLTKAGIPATESSWWGDGGSFSGSQTLAVIDNRVVMGSGWGALTANTMGGRIIANSTTLSAFSFTPEDQFDRAVIWYDRNTGYGTFTVNVDGGATIATVDSNGAASIQKLVINVPLGTHTINLQRTGVGGEVRLHGMEVYRSDLSQVRVYNMGWAGSTSANWAGRSAFSDPLWFVYQVAPATTILNLGINDVRGGLIAVDQYKTNMQFIIDKVQDASKIANGGNLVLGDVILEVPNPHDPSSFSGGQAAIDAFMTAVYELSAANGNLPVIDLYKRWNNFTSAKFLGKLYDSVHPDGPGYADLGLAEYGVLMGAVG